MTSSVLPSRLQSLLPNFFSQSSSLDSSKEDAKGIFFDNEQLRALCINLGGLDVDGVLKEEPAKEIFPCLSSQLLCYVIDYLTTPRSIIGSHSTFTIADLLLYLDPFVADIQDIKIIGSQVLWQLTQGKTDDTYLKAILQALGIEAADINCLDAISTPFDLDLVFLLKSEKDNKHSYEKIQKLQSKVKDFFKEKGVESSPAILFLILPPLMLMPILRYIPKRG